MAGKKKTGKKKSGVKATGSGNAITIRMYNVGFGDAFLVRIPVGSGQRKILFDCGSIEAAENVAMKDVVQRIVQDATDADGKPRIDVVVATHRHKDHVSGFESAAWAGVEVQEVWMPWTEHPTDPEARKIRTTQAGLALALDSSLSTRPAAAAEAARARSIVANSLMLTNDKAMKLLHSGFVGDPSRWFLPEPQGADSKRSRTFTTPALPGIKVHVLGPSRGEDVIRDMDPPTGKSYLRLQVAVNGGAGGLPAPFKPEFGRSQRDNGAALMPAELDEIHKAGSSSDLAVAVALDKAVNGTSLMLMLEVSGTFLLFPGDAQWGTWNAAMRDPEWGDLLKRVAFYKIGHHGSHNATPVDFVEDMLPAGIAAMASTLTRDVWPDIPRGPLLKALAAKHTDVARSDQPGQVPQRFKLDNGVIEARIPL
jgi:beta-lactamase superfamily II metal-dependent hydrolase